MRHLYLGLCGLLVTFIWLPTLAQQQALITVDPNNFAPGQNISNATTGVQLLVMRGVPNPDPNAPPQQAFVIQYSPAVYALPGVTFPDAPTGNLVFGYTGGSLSTNPDMWGEQASAVNCLTGPCPAEFGLTIDPVLRVSFTVPTDHVDAVSHFFEDTPTFMTAFNSAGQVLDSCGTGFGECSVKLTPETDNTGWYRITIAHSVADISFVVIGGFTEPQPSAQVRFNSPVSLQLAGLLASVQGVGPGHSLANTVMQAQAFYAVPDIQSTCAQLGSFVGEVNAQSGKKIANLTALQLLSTATAIQAAIGCN